jgi:hypothetical protein
MKSPAEHYSTDGKMLTVVVFHGYRNFDPPECSRVVQDNPQIVALGKQMNLCLIVIRNVLTADTSI